MASGSPSTFSVARKFRESDAVQEFIAGHSKSVGISLNSREILNNTIVTADPTSPPQQLPNVVGLPAKPTGLRELFQNIPATGGSFTYQKELVFTDAAEAQNGDGTAKAESGLTYSEIVQPISTYAHWLKISKQVLSDAPQTTDFTARRPLNGLESKVESAMIQGDGTNGKLSGLLDVGNSTIQAPAAGTDSLENLRAAKKAIQLVDFNCTLFVLHPTDAAVIDLIQSTTGEYIYGQPRGADGTMVWGVPVYISRYMTAGSIIALDTVQAATVHMREDALMTLSDSDGTDFTKNLSTMLVELRMGFAVHHATGIISGLLNGA